MKEKKIRGRINYKIAGLTILLTVIGLFIILSASSYLTIKHDVGRFYYVKKQAVFAVLGILAMFIFSFIDYRYYKRFYILIFVLSIGLITLNRIPFFSVSFNDFAHRAIRIGPITFMTSDVYKIGSILFLAEFLIRNKNNFDSFWKGFIVTCLIILLPSALILLQPDLSTFITIVATLGLMYLMFGFRKKYLPIVILAFVGAVFVFFKFGKAYQMSRIQAYLDPEKYYRTSAWQVLNSLFAVSRGGLTGVGYGKAVFKHGYLADEVYNDMVFAVIAEEFGFIGSLIIILLVFLIFYYIMQEAMRSKDMYAKIVCFGFGCLYLIQSMINIGVSINLIPNTGITLPFISYGGTSLVIYFAMVGILLNISRHNDLRERQEKKEKTKNYIK